MNRFNIHDAADDRRDQQAREAALAIDPRNTDESPLTPAEFAIPSGHETRGTLSADEKRMASTRLYDRVNVAEWAAGSRIADDRFCQQCGARGVRGRYCAACEGAK